MVSIAGRIAKGPVWPKPEIEHMMRAGYLDLQQEMAIFQSKIIIFQGQFSILSAFPIENSKRSWHFYCKLQYIACRASQPRPRRSMTPGL